PPGARTAAVAPAGPGRDPPARSPRRSPRLMLPPDVRAVFFDAVGTLLHLEEPPAVVYARVGRRHGSRLAEDVVAPRFREASRPEEDHAFRHGVRTDEDRERQRWRRIVATVLDDTADAEGCFAELFDHYGRADAWRCAPDTAATLAGLARRGLTLGVA